MRKLDLRFVALALAIPSFAEAPEGS